MFKKLNPNSLYRVSKMAFQGDSFAKIDHEFAVHRKQYAIRQGARNDKRLLRN